MLVSASNFSFESQDLAPARIRDIDPQGIDASQAFVCGRVNCDCENRFPVILSFYRSVEIAGRLYPLEFECSVSSGQYGLHVDADRFRRCPFLRWIVTVKLRHECLC